MLERFDLTEAAGRAVKTYSGGMRRRLDLAASLIGYPSVLFLDEPTTGLDPNARAMTWEIVRGLADSGTTLLLTTQYLDEADQLAGRIAVIDGGTVIAEGTPDQLKSALGGEHLEVTLAAGADVEAAIVAVKPYAAGSVQPDEDGTRARERSVFCLDCGQMGRESLDPLLCFRSGLGDHSSSMFSLAKRTIAASFSLISFAAMRQTSSIPRARGIAENLTALHKPF